MLGAPPFCVFCPTNSEKEGIANGKEDTAVRLPCGTGGKIVPFAGYLLPVQ